LPAPLGPRNPKFRLAHLEAHVIHGHELSEDPRQILREHRDRSTGPVRSGARYHGSLILSLGMSDRNASSMDGTIRLSESTAMPPCSRA